MEVNETPFQFYVILDWKQLGACSSHVASKVRSAWDLFRRCAIGVNLCGHDMFSQCLQGFPSTVQIHAGRRIGDAK